MPPKRLGPVIGVWNLMVLAAYLIWASWLLLTTPDDGCYDVPFECADSPIQQALTLSIFLWAPAVVISNVLIIIVGIAVVVGAKIARD